MTQLGAIFFFVVLALTLVAFTVAMPEQHWHMVEMQQEEGGGGRPMGDDMGLWRADETAPETGDDSQAPAEGAEGAGQDQPKPDGANSLTQPGASGGGKGGKAGKQAGAGNKGGKQPAAAGGKLGGQKKEVKPLPADANEQGECEWMKPCAGHANCGGSNDEKPGPVEPQCGMAPGVFGAKDTKHCNCKAVQMTCMLKPCQKDADCGNFEGACRPLASLAGANATTQQHEGDSSANPPPPKQNNWCQCAEAAKEHIAATEQQPSDGSPPPLNALDQFCKIEYSREACKGLPPMGQCKFCKPKPITPLQPADAENQPQDSQPQDPKPKGDNMEAEEEEEGGGDGILDMP